MPDVRAAVFRGLIVSLVAFTSLLCSLPQAHARTRLENICRVYGQQERKLIGLGLVVGLNGTGDGGKSLPTMRALKATLERLNSPATIAELQQSKNVAVVNIEATVPATGLRAGQKVDCHVSSVFGAKSLYGGRLIYSVLTSELSKDARVEAIASGQIKIEDKNNELTGIISGGAILEQSQIPQLFQHRSHRIVTLLLHESHASFHTASEVVRAVNNEFSFEAGGTELARAENAGVIHVRVPQQYQADPVRFLALLMDVGLENPHTQARVIVNTKTGVIVVTGEVEISPVLIAHQNLTVQIGDAPPGQGAEPPRFVPVYDRDPGAAPQKLDDLIRSLNQLRVPTADIIAILRDLNRSGKLHAVYQEDR